MTMRTNNSGAIQGGISDGAHKIFTAVFKPLCWQAQTTASYEGEEGVLEAKGRHDSYAVPRAVTIVESMTAF